MARQVYFLDLKSEAMAAEYEAYHAPGGVPAKVLADIRGAGILSMQIYRLGKRLVLISETDDDAVPTDRISSQASRDWEDLMSLFQQPLEQAREGEKWLGAAKIFDLSAHDKIG